MFITCCWPEQAVEQTVKLSLVWDALMLMWHYCNPGYTDYNTNGHGTSSYKRINMFRKCDLGIVACICGKSGIQIWTIIMEISVLISENVFQKFCMWKPTCLHMSQLSHWHNTDMFVTDLQKLLNYSDVIMSAMASQIPSVSIVYLTVCTGADQRKHQSSTSLAFVRGIHWWIPRTKCQQRGKYFHLMTPSWKKCNENVMRPE